LRSNIVKPAAELAWEGDGEQHAGEHCQFCKIKAECRERARANLELAKNEFKEPPFLEIKEIAAILDQADEFTRWLSDVKEYALTTALQGKKYPGYKLVEGRSNREYTDETVIAARLRNAGYYDIFKEPKRVVSVTVTPKISDCTGTVYFSDIQLQEGDKLTGYAQNTETMLVNSDNAPRYQNGVVRGGETIILFNTGGTDAGLDVYVYPKQTRAAGSIEVGQGMGSHKCRFTAAASAGDEFALKASTRECLRNGSATGKQGFFQYTAAYDSKHQIKVEDKKSARV
jgi:hypothetical protein